MENYFLFKPDYRYFSKRFVKVCQFRLPEECFRLSSAIKLKLSNF